MKPNEEGITFGEPSDVYQADAVYEIPSLSSSLAKLLIAETPRHAWYASRRLNPKFRDEHKPEWDRGTIAHALILNSADQSKIYKIAATDWKKPSTRILRDEVRAAGGIPILECDYDELMEMRDAALKQLDALEGGNPFAVGQPEVVIRWREEFEFHGRWYSVWCRSRLDWFNSESENFYDLKTSAGSMNPVTWSKWRMWDIGAPYQSAFYRRGLRRLAQLKLLHQFDADALFCLHESKAPYGVSLVNIPSDIRQPYQQANADEKVAAAMALWQRCLENNEWFGYPPEIYFAEGAKPLIAPRWSEQDAASAAPQHGHLSSEDIAAGL